MADELKITMILPKDIEVKSYLECSKHEGFSASYTEEGLGNILNHLNLEHPGWNEYESLIKRAAVWY